MVHADNRSFEVCPIVVPAGFADNGRNDQPGKSRLSVVQKNDSRNRRANYLAGVVTVLLILADCKMGRALMLQAGTKDFITTPGIIISTVMADTYERNH